MNNSTNQNVNNTINPEIDDDEITIDNQSDYDTSNYISSSEY